ncbi:hypothetical protein FB451DRAFT_1370557 [Mycena latifolia]|nr:hypothetical protein FB451DRAFT_1370557 [Mycena latifolia]
MSPSYMEMPSRLYDDEFDDDEYEGEYMQYSLDLGADSEPASECPTPRRKPSLQALQLSPLRQECGINIEDVPPSPAESEFEPDSSSFSSPPSIASESEDEDATDYSFPALQHARTLQSRRHAAHPLSSVIGLRGAFFPLVRALGCVVVVAVLAGRGGWGAATA